MFRTSGTNPAPIPWILCGPALPSDNTGDVAAKSYSSGNIYFGAGGIIGTIYSNVTATTTKSKATITNSYNRGNITNSYSSNNAGQIMGMDYSNNGSITNCYYLNTATGKNTYGGTAVTDIKLKGYATILGREYTNDKTEPINE